MDNSLQNKLTRFEETPPAGAWDKIAAALEPDGNYVTRLYNYTQNPPLAVWNSIEKSLDAEAQTGKVIPFTTRFKRPIRYVAAASIIGLIAVTTTLLLRRTEAGALQAGSETTVPVKKSLVIKKGEPLIVLTEKIKQPNPIVGRPGFSGEAEQVQEKRSASTRKRFSGFIAPQNIARSFALLGRFIPKAADAKEVSDFTAASNYMVYSDGDGNAMKLPKKLFTLVNCRDGDGSCRERINQLQQKLSSAAITADFTGVLEMLRQLQ